MHDAVIVSAARTAVGKAPNGALRTVRPDEMAATVIGESLRRAPGVSPDEIDDVILGCAMPEAEQGLNVARIASLRAGVPVQASAVTINRFCSSGLQAIAFAAERIMCGWAQAIVAGGTESMSLVPMGGNKVSPNPALVDSYPDVYLTTGLVAAAISAPIAAVVFGGVTGGGTDALIALFRTFGLNVFQSAFAQGLTSDPLDKTLSYTIVFVILGALPVTVRTMYSRGEATVQE